MELEEYHFNYKTGFSLAKTLGGPLEKSSPHPLLSREDGARNFLTSNVL